MSNKVIIAYIIYLRYNMTYTWEVLNNGILSHVQKNYIPSPLMKRASASPGAAVAMNASPMRNPWKPVVWSSRAISGWNPAAVR